MATMVKEKRREKKKTRDKRTSNVLPQEQLKDDDCILFKDKPEDLKETKITDKDISVAEQTDYIFDSNKEGLTSNIQKVDIQTCGSSIEQYDTAGDCASNITERSICEKTSCQITKEEIDIPSAPDFDEETSTNHVAYNTETDIPDEETKTRIQCMSLLEAVRLFGWTEISEVRAIGEKEESIVEAGPISGPEHPLVDLLSMFRSSVNTMESKRTTLSQGFIQEEKSRSLLWKVEKDQAFVTEKCSSCDKSLSLKVTFEVAKLQKEKIPAARLRLEALARDVQDSYCHHQHSALLAYCQIEELVYETMRSNKGDIREALSLILQALRLSDGISEAYTSALQRWAIALSAMLLDGRDLRQLIFLIHHLFRQTRSVRWASQVIRVQVTDLGAVARVIALLELMLTRPGLTTAIECTEELVDTWEEVGKSGEGCAVSEGRLRERDALALLKTLPLRQVLAKLALFTRSDITSTQEHEWGDGSGGHGVLKAVCGVRILLSVLQRAVYAHAHYERLQRALQVLCACALHLLAALHLRSRPSYHHDLHERVQAELEASFMAGFVLFNAVDLERLPATLLGDNAAKDYCVGLMLTLHDKNPHRISSLGADLPPLRCDARVRILLQAGLDRTDDNDLARILLEFLCQIAIKRKPLTCRNPCDLAARQGLPQLLAVHPYLHATSLHILADLNGADPVDSSSVSYLSVQEWYPHHGEVLGVLEDWSQRCPQLIEHLLLQLEYTPHQGISLETQLIIGRWLCEHMRNVGGEAAEWAWQVLRRLHVHRAEWGLPLDAPHPDPEPHDLLSTAFALLSTSWGHSVPLICSAGAKALCRLARARAREAVHCLGAMMRAVQHTPESIALTPEFTEVFSILLSTGPSLMARALGRGGPYGADLLEEMLLKELQSKNNVRVLKPWLRGLWAPSLPGAARALLDTGVRVARDWPALDATVAILLQGENVEFVSDAVRNAAVAPLLCEAALRGAHARYELPGQTWPRLMDALAAQRAKGQKIHVDNAIKQMGTGMNAEELVLYRAATAALAAPLHHPAHLTLWRLFFHLYLQRPPSSLQNAAPPVGPLFFSGIIKSHVLSQLKKRLQETITYHHLQVERLKAQDDTVRPEEAVTSGRNMRTSPTTDSNLFPTISIIDLTGERSSSDSETDSSEEETLTAGLQTDMSTITSQEKFHLSCYHVAAEKLVREYCHWLVEGDKVRAMPHHADIARFISEQALNAAWRSSLPSWFLETSPPQPRTPRQPPRTHLQLAIDSLLKINDRSTTRPRIPHIKPLLEDQDNLGDARAIFNLIDRHLKDMEAVAQEWSGDMERLSKLDSKLFEWVCALRVRRPLPSCVKWCGNNTCKPSTLVPNRHEWVISTGAEQGIQENRRCALGILRRLARPRPQTARDAAVLEALVRHVRSSETARRVVERAGRSADAVGEFSPALNAINSLVTNLAERWLCGDAASCGKLVRAWGMGGAGRRALCSALVVPRRLQPAAFLQLYETLLTAPLPGHAAFSYLSRFEIGTWAERVDPAQREKMLDIIIQAAQRWGPNPGPESHVLLELMGVHMRAVCGVGELCGVVLQCARASGRGTLPAGMCTHVTNAAAHAHSLNYNQLGNLLRELGTIWWEVRTSITAESDVHEPYATHAADLLQILQQAFVANTKALDHDIEKVSWFAWSALREAWVPWVHPGHALPLLPVTQTSNAHADMLQRFVDTLLLTIKDCPGSEEFILRYVWEWAVHTYLSVSTPQATQESRVQLSALLAALQALPWLQTQWMHANCLPLALQISRSTDKEITSWCIFTWRDTTADTWLRGVPDEQLAPHLAAVLSIFCSAELQLSPQTLDEATLLPWHRIPEAALDAAFEQFFVDHHNPAIPYHEIPQFRVLLYASQLSLVDGTAACNAASRSRRARGVSQCVRAAAAPPLLQHVRVHTEALLRTLTDLAPHIESSEGEIEELLSRAIVIMCMEPAAAVALPVWEQWIRDSKSRLQLAGAAAVASLTTLEYFVPLADAVARAHMIQQGEESDGWGALRKVWASCVWEGSAACAAAATRHSWHAAYALLPARDVPVAVLRTLSTQDLATSHDDPIMAVWVCVAYRLARQPSTEVPPLQDSPLKDELEENQMYARSMLRRWATEPRRSLLQVVAMQHDNQTARIRLLCRFAQCILNPSSESLVRAYEATCAALLGSNQPDVSSWGKTPRPKLLPRLALRLYPGREAYFKEEMELIIENT